jgi:hypothetical protein
MFPYAIMVQTVSDLRRQELLVRTECERRADEVACPHLSGTTWRCALLPLRLSRLARASSASEPGPLHSTTHGTDRNKHTPKPGARVSQTSIGARKPRQSSAQAR